MKKYTLVVKLLVDVHRSCFLVEGGNKICEHQQHDVMLLSYVVLQSYFTEYVFLLLMLFFNACFLFY